MLMPQGRGAAITRKNDGEAPPIVAGLGHLLYSHAAHDIYVQYRHEYI